MFENIVGFFKNIKKTEKGTITSKNAAKERLHLVLMQDRANVSADFLDLMKQEIIEVIKKYIEVDESSIDVRLTNKQNDDGTTGAPALYANIPIINIKQEARVKESKKAEEEKEIINEAKQIIADTQTDSKIDIPVDMETKIEENKDAEEVVSKNDQSLNNEIQGETVENTGNKKKSDEE